MCAVASVAILVALTSMSSSSSAEQAGPLDERQVKAAFLFNFTKFVDWPAAGSGPLVIGIAGDEEFAQIVEAVVRGRTAKGRELTIRRLLDGEDPTGCQIIFIPGSRPREAAEALQRVSGPILTVGETPSFLRDGGMVRFFVDNRHIRFEIHQKNAVAKGLKISSQLLTLAAR